MITLQDLEQAFAPLSEIGHKEKEFDLFGMKVTLTTLTPLQESSVQRAVSEDQEDTEVLALEFVDKFRAETLCRSIVKINDFDLRSSHVLTGEILESGVQVKITKEEAVGKLISSWSRTVISQVYNSYAKLVEEVEKELDEKFDIKSLEVEDEKENLKDRLEKIENAENLEAVSNTSKESVSISNSSEYSNALKGMGQ